MEAERLQWLFGLHESKPFSLSGLDKLLRVEGDLELKYTTLHVHACSVCAAHVQSGNDNLRFEFSETLISSLPALQEAGLSRCACLTIPSRQVTWPHDSTGSCHNALWGRRVLPSIHPAGEFSGSSPARQGQIVQWPGPGPTTNGVAAGCGPLRQSLPRTGNSSAHCTAFSISSHSYLCFPLSLPAPAVPDEDGIPSRDPIKHPRFLDALVWVNLEYLGVAIRTRTD